MKKINRNELAQACITLKTNVDRYVIYVTLLESCLDELVRLYPQYSAVIRDLKKWINGISAIAKFCLVDRFVNPPKQKIRSAKRIKTLSRDLILFLETEKPKKKPSPESVLDLIAALKLLENFILRRSYMKSTVGLELGRFKSEISDLISNLPKLLLDVDSVTDNEAKRKLLSLLFSSIIIYRQFKCKTEPSASTMLAVYAGKKDLKTLIATEFSDLSIQSWIQTLNIDLAELKAFSRLSIYSGNASSPNGGASASNILKDVAAVANDTKLFAAIKNLASHFYGHKEFELILETLALNVSIDSEFSKETIHSRLFHFTAPGGKARVIANVDWVSQTALSAIHFTLFKLLSELIADCTFNHKRGIELHDQPLDNNTGFFSIDLSAATDRMPRLLQSRLIAGIWTSLGYDGQQIAKQWLAVVDRQYDTGKSLINNGMPVRYAVGQGMGLFSSWVSMAITHHYIANYLCKIPMSQYRLVGDDLLIRGTREQFEAYLAIMADIGLEVNLNKTITSERTNSHNIEFARNYIVSGVHITTLPFGQLFAFAAGTCAFETSVSTITDLWTADTMKRIIDVLCDINTAKMVELVFYLYAKKGFALAQIPWVDQELNKLSWINETNLDKIKHVLEQARNGLESVIPVGQHTVSFLNALRSQCTMRTIQDVLRSRDFSESIVLIQYADDRLTEAANLFYERLVNAHVIAYDVDDLGSPLLTKRERKLLAEVLKLYAKTK